jgi:hypothetical protein
MVMLLCRFRKKSSLLSRFVLVQRKKGKGEIDDELQDASTEWRV